MLNTEGAKLQGSMCTGSGHVKGCFIILLTREMYRQREDEFSLNLQVKLERIGTRPELLGCQAPWCLEDVGANGLALAGRQLSNRCPDVK